MEEIKFTAKIRKKIVKKALRTVKFIDELMTLSDEWEWRHWNQNLDGRMDGWKGGELEVLESKLGWKIGWMEGWGIGGTGIKTWMEEWMDGRVDALGQTENKRSGYWFKKSLREC